MDEQQQHGPAYVSVQCDQRSCSHCYARMTRLVSIPKMFRLVNAIHKQSDRILSGRDRLYLKACFFFHDKTGIAQVVAENVVVFVLPHMSPIA